MDGTVGRGQRLRDYNDLYNAYEDAQAKAEAKLPHCIICGEPIYGDYLWDFGDGPQCADCVNRYRKSTDLYGGDY